MDRRVQAVAFVKRDHETVAVARVKRITVEEAGKGGIRHDDVTGVLSIGLTRCFGLRNHGLTVAASGLHISGVKDRAECERKK
jgi:hypothetical protein